MVTKNKQAGSQKKGFSLVELLVALTVFLVLVTLGIGSLLRMIDAHAKTQSLQLIMNNLNFTLEGISRHVRFGHDYDCGRPGGDVDCAPASEGGDWINVKFEGEDVRYRLMRFDGLKEPPLDEDEQGAIFRMIRIETPPEGYREVWERVTSAEVDIDALRFYVFDANDSDYDQPRVTIVIDGTAQADGGVSTDFTLQTTVNQRENES